MFENSEELRSILQEEDKLNSKGFSNTNKSFSPLIILLLITTGLMIYFGLQNFNIIKKDFGIDEKVDKETLNKVVAFGIENEELKVELKKLKEEMQVLKEKKQEVKIEEKIVTINKVNKKNFTSIFNSKNTKILKCYDYAHGNFNPTKTCKKNLKTFVKKNAKALRFELISVMSKKDEDYYKNYKKSTSDLLLNGLSVKRLHELTWYLKKSLGEKTIVTSNNFYIKSDRRSSGILIKAYY